MYVRTWVWLLVFTLLELGAATVALPRAVTVTLLVALALMKGSLIVAYFMHLRFERLQFVYAVLSPFIFTIILFGAIAPDAIFRVH
ncbi:MAG: cytochrome C oxidase subunit IV family protein [Limnochordaceae bacterium]|nr:cytochrome C oxidase subunit IV family protein [Limnochordaceae bacterium]